MAQQLAYRVALARLIWKPSSLKAIRFGYKPNNDYDAQSKMEETVYITKW